MNNAIATVIRGFLLGLGFAVAAIGAAFVAQTYWMNQYQSAAEGGAYPGIDSIGESARKFIVLSDVEEQKSDGRVAVIGTLKNTGSKPARGIQIEVELFLKGKFVDQYSTYISGSVGAGESRHFKVACGCKDSPPAEHDSFKAEVRGGF
jgi:hypothetical protein